MTTRNSFQQEYTSSTSTLKSEIRKVLCFEHPVTKRRVQVIFAYGDQKRILSQFDFSFCAVGYDPQKETFFGLCLALTKSMRGVEMNTARSSERQAIRLAKYVKRGFTLIQ